MTFQGVDLSVTPAPRERNAKSAQQDWPGTSWPHTLPSVDAPSAVLKDFAARNSQLKLIILFGSHAKGKARPDSDVDVAVWPTTPLSAEQWLTLREELAWALKRTVDVVDASTLHGPLLNEILDSGKKVFEREGSRTLEALMRRRVYDEADFMPLYRKAQAIRRERFLNTPLLPHPNDT